ncbi:CubicO group peptidase, beta-lactamase class C family [Dyadobacter soli]|uniref:CubicO group peptidase, beta-lactamase class C family n=1 Tax=Dyadobacter soli TaxID=659014 RepID=A0A1G7T4N8_9BACT|nr:serine hydrolase domain-containing protein [Dyadobacter soli]SDG29580.1 CubicO group peptidase, beta-lactamase class C family [Dyadobacter soli]
MNRLQILILAFICVLGLLTRSIAQIQKEQIDLLDSYLSVQQQSIGFNGTVMITRNDSIIYQRSVGKASLELDVTFSSDPVFRIASITKQFTAMLIVLAAEEQKLSLGDHLSKYFPRLSQSDWPNITIRQLLTHTSGLPHDEGIADYWEKISFLPLSERQAADEILKLKLLSVPGTETHYSSPGYFLLASILEIVYHKSYDAILREKITAPLHMDHTGVGNATDIIKGMVSPYHQLANRLIAAPHRDSALMKGSGNMYSTASDLSKWNNALNGSSHFNKMVIDQLFTIQNSQPVNGRSESYGYGWFLRRTSNRERDFNFTGGGTYGCSAISGYYPNAKISVVILSNVSTLPVGEMQSDIESIVFGDSFDMPVAQTQVVMDASQLDKFQGAYTADSGHVLLIFFKGEQLYAKMGQNPFFELYPSENLVFFGKKVPVQIEFENGSDNTIKGLKAKLKGQSIHFLKSR